MLGLVFPYSFLFKTRCYQCAISIWGQTMNLHGNTYFFLFFQTAEVYMVSVFAKIQLSLVISRPGKVTIAITAGHTHPVGDRECSEVMVLVIQFSKLFQMSKTRVWTMFGFCYAVMKTKWESLKNKKNSLHLISIYYWQSMPLLNVALLFKSGEFCIKM